MDQNLVVWRVREKEADIPWFTWKANRVLFLGLVLLHVGTVRLLKRVLEARARKKVSSAGLCAPRN